LPLNAGNDKHCLLRQQNPEAADLLTRTDAMTIPAHSENSKILRPKSVGAIFMSDHNQLYLRYFCKQS
jgi:hypothetical protein